MSMIFTLLQHVSGELRRRKARTLMTVLGYGLAVSSMMVLVGVLRVSGQRSATILDHTGTHFVAYAPADPATCAGGGPCLFPGAAPTPGEGFVAFGTRTRVLPDDYAEKIRALPAVAEAAACLLYRLRDDAGQLFTVAGVDLGSAMVVGTTCCAATDVVQGRFLRENDTGRVMVEQAYARAMRLETGRMIRIAQCRFTIAGIINPGIRPAKADLYMPYAEAEQLIDARARGHALAGRANLILVEVKDSSVQEQAIREVKALYPDLVVSSYACYRPAAEARSITTTAIRGLVVAIGLFTVLLAVVSQMNVVVERRREIGILKTLGFSNRRIMAQVMMESVTQAGAGALLAGGVVWAMMPWTGWQRLFPGDAPWLQWIQPAICAQALLLAIAGGLLAGLLPAVWAGRQRVAGLLRTF